MASKFDTDNPGAGVPAPPSSITIGGDPSQYIYSDPGYQALLAALQGNEGAQTAADRAQIQQDAIRSGYYSDALSPYLDAGMQGQIQSNPYSLQALASQGHTTNVRNIQNSLAARGGYNSGELTYGIGNESQRFNQENLSNEQSLMDQINALLGGEASTKASDAQQEAQALGDATARQSSLHPVSTATYDASTGTYVDTYGNHFNADGSAYTAPKTPTPPPAAPPAPKFTAPTQPGYGGPFGSHVGAPPMGAPTPPSPTHITNGMPGYNGFGAVTQ